ncbi:hypothetical protein [Dactylosporangium sp. NPDC005555]|uniref:hypothetical protein n=1 Tax=Dactylosporangium sp. NPDC005555 TaxID=3154889 RepID=UPI00339DDF60
MPHSPALRTAGRIHCEASGGRPMREWVRIPSPDLPLVLAYVVEARTFVAGSS